MTRIFSNLFVVQGSISFYGNYCSVSLCRSVCAILCSRSLNWILSGCIYLPPVPFKGVPSSPLVRLLLFCRWIGLNPPSPLFKLHLYLILLDNGAPLDKELEPNIHYIPPYPLEDDNNWSQATRRYINKYVNFYVMLMVESVSTNHCSVPVVHYTVHWISIDLKLMINDDQSIAIYRGRRERSNSR